MKFEEYRVVSVPRHRIILEMDRTPIMADFRKSAERNSVIAYYSLSCDDYNNTIMIYAIASYPRVYRYLKSLRRKYDFNVQVLEPLV